MRRKKVIRHGAWMLVSRFCSWLLYRADRLQARVESKMCDIEQTWPDDWKDSDQEW